MVHELLKDGEFVKERFGNNVYVTDKRIVKTDRETYFEDLNLSAVESIEVKISHYELLLRIGSSFLILYTLFIVLNSVGFIQSLGVNFSTVSITCLILAIASLVAYFVLRSHVTKIYGSNKVITIRGHDWDVVSSIRHHSFDKQEGTQAKKSRKK